MTDIGYGLSKLIEKYCNDKIGKERFKHKLQKFERNTEGANWWTMCTGIWSEADSSCHFKLIEPVAELYGDEDIERILPNKEELEEGEIKNKLSQLPIHSKFILQAITNLEKNGVAPTEHYKIYEKYTNICDKQDTDSVTIQVLQERIFQLRQKGLVVVVNSDDELRDLKYELDIRAKVVDEALDLDV